jgi:hypothetical protein
MDDYFLNKLFPTKIQFVVVNVCIFISCYSFNNTYQIFCKPVPWAAVLIILFCVSFLILPFIKNTIILNILSVFCGLGLFITLYLLIFARQEYLIFVAINSLIILPLFLILWFHRKKFNTNVFNAYLLYPTILLTPFLLLFQLWLMLNSSKNKNQKRLFITTPILTLLISLLFTLQINSIRNRTIVS